MIGRIPLLQCDSDNGVANRGDIISPNLPETENVLSPWTSQRNVHVFSKSRYSVHHRSPNREVCKRAPLELADMAMLRSNFEAC